MEIKNMKFKTGDKVKITKLAEAEQALAETARSIDEYRKTLFDKYGFSPPVDYWVEGVLSSDLSVGETLTMNRSNRNGIIVDGLFSTTQITDHIDSEVLGNYSLFKTRNSIYKIEKINE